MRRILITASSALLLATTLSGTPAGAGTPEDAIKYRQAVMNTMAGHVGAITLIVSGKVDHQAYLLSHAEALAAAGEQLGQIFPAGTDTGKTDALPLIWGEPDKFQKAAEAGKAATAQLRDAVKSGDKAAINKSLKPVFDSCKGCHDRYRKED